MLMTSTTFLETTTQRSVLVTEKKSLITKINYHFDSTLYIYPLIITISQ